MRQSLRKPEILRGYRSFHGVLSKGTSYKSGPLRCFVLRDNSFSLSLQVGFSVGKSIRIKPIRNRIKRLMRESYRLRPERDLNTLHHTRIVFLFTGQIPRFQGSITLTDIQPHLLELLKKAESAQTERIQ